MTGRLLALLLLASVASGCLSAVVAGGNPGDVANVWSEDGYEQQRFGWKVRFAEGGKDLVSPDWTLSSGGSKGEGEIAESKYTSRSDLRFTNIHNNGVIWTDTETLEPELATKDLDVLFENYASGLASEGFGGRAIMVDRGDLKLGESPALSAIIERERTKEEREGNLTTNAPKLRIVITKFDYLELPPEPLFVTDDDPAGALGSGPGTHKARPRTPPARQRRTALMVIGYANDSNHFDPGLADFAKFLGRFSWPSPLTPKTPGAKPASKPEDNAASPAEKPQAPDPDKPSLQI